MNRLPKVIGIVSLIFFFLIGCTEIEEEKEKVVSGNSKEVPTNLSKTITMNIEDELEDNLDTYTFNGFVGEDTLSFEKVNIRSKKSYHPAKIGHTFQLKELEGIQFKIITFSREEGYVKLEITGTKMPRVQ